MTTPNNPALTEGEPTTPEKPTEGTPENTTESDLDKARLEDVLALPIGSALADLLAHGAAA